MPQRRILSRSGGEALVVHEAGGLELRVPVLLRGEPREHRLFLRRPMTRLGPDEALAEELCLGRGEIERHLVESQRIGLWELRPQLGRVLRWVVPGAEKSLPVATVLIASEQVAVGVDRAGDALVADAVAPQRGPVDGAR